MAELYRQTVDFEDSPADMQAVSPAAFTDEGVHEIESVEDVAQYAPDGEGIPITEDGIWGGVPPSNERPAEVDEGLAPPRSGDLGNDNPPPVEPPSHGGEINDPGDPGEIVNAGGVDWRLKQVHLIGSRVLEGPHPDEAVNREMRRGLEDAAVEPRLVREFMDSAPNNDRPYAEIIDEVRTALVEDFGEGMSDMSIHVVRSELYEAAFKAFGWRRATTSNAIASFGGVLVRENDYIAQFGPRYLRSVLLHEGAHAAAHDPMRVEYYSIQESDPADAADRRRLMGTMAPGLLYARYTDGELKPEGDFWEESFADEYTASRAVRDGTALDLPYPVAFESDGVKINLVDDTPGRYRHYDPGADAVNIPWRYAHGTSVVDANHTGVNLSSRAAGAFGLHLLEHRLPGLFDDAMQSRTDIRARERFRAGVNSIRPHLFEQLGTLQGSWQDFRDGLLVIESALGLLDEPLQTRL
jgi:hypothetical protein